ncbi:MAG: hypothetical protein PHX98_02495 [Candidatus Moranbacteria bacterium]|nr:hypothetical protein [Candidatus Moranbacteria bacterium]
MEKIFKSEFFVTLAVMAAALFLHKIFRVSDNFQTIAATISFLFLIPVLYIKIILKKPLKNFGMRIGDFKKGILYAIFSSVIFAAVFYFLSAKFDFFGKYVVPAHIVDNFTYFVYREVLVVGFFLALYEFFFRGFTLFYFYDKFKSGIYAVLFQTVLFLAFLALVNSFNWSTLPYMVMAPLAGLVAYKSNSILFSFLLSWISILILDSISVKIIIDSVIK